MNFECFPGGVRYTIHAWVYYNTENIMYSSMTAKDVYTDHTLCWTHIICFNNLKH